jgi:hypothetical protein
MKRIIRVEANFQCAANGVFGDKRATAFAAFVERPAVPELIGEDASS